MFCCVYIFLLLILLSSRVCLGVCMRMPAPVSFLCAVLWVHLHTCVYDCVYERLFLYVDNLCAWVIYTFSMNLCATVLCMCLYVYVDCMCQETTITFVLTYSFIYSSIAFHVYAYCTCTRVIQCTGMFVGTTGSSIQGNVPVVCFIRRCCSVW